MKQAAHHRDATLQMLGLILSGGWDPETGEINTEINAQIDQAFKNVDLNLRDAGGKGWSQVCSLLGLSACCFVLQASLFFDYGSLTPQPRRLSEHSFLFIADTTSYEARQ